jgi:hypothetical protein
MKGRASTILNHVEKRLNGLPKIATTPTKKSEGPAEFAGPSVIGRGDPI